MATIREEVSTSESGAKLSHDEIRCSGCGAAVKIAAVLCMRCGVRVESQPLTKPTSLLSDAVTIGATGQRSLKAWSTVILALLGGILGIVGAIQSELWATFSLVTVITAPVAEELFKPFGLYLILILWPGTLKTQLATAGLSALGGLAFGLVESGVYLTVYVSDPSPSYAAFRLTVPIAIHVLASFIFGLGLNRKFLVSLAQGRPSGRNWMFFVGAFAVHAIYNATVMALRILDGKV